MNLCETLFHLLGRVGVLAKLPVAFVSLFAWWDQYAFDLTNWEQDLLALSCYLYETDQLCRNNIVTFPTYSPTCS